MAQETIAYRVYEMIGERALGPEKGEHLHALIAPHIRAGRHVTLDFEGVRIISAVFWEYVAVPLTDSLDPKTVQQRLTLLNLPNYAQGLVPTMLEHGYRWRHDPAYRARVEARRAAYAKEFGDDYADFS